MGFLELFKNFKNQNGISIQDKDRTYEFEITKNALNEFASRVDLVQECFDMVEQIRVEKKFDVETFKTNLDLANKKLKEFSNLDEKFVKSMPDKKLMKVYSNCIASVNTLIDMTTLEGVNYFDRLAHSCDFANDAINDLKQNDFAIFSLKNAIKFGQKYIDATDEQNDIMQKDLELFNSKYEFVMGKMNKEKEQFSDEVIKDLMNCIASVYNELVNIYNNVEDKKWSKVAKLLSKNKRNLRVELSTAMKSLNYSFEALHNLQGMEIEPIKLNEPNLYYVECERNQELREIYEII